MKNIFYILFAIQFLANANCKANSIFKMNKEKTGYLSANILPHQTNVMKENTQMISSALASSEIINSINSFEANENSVNENRSTMIKILLAFEIIAAITLCFIFMVEYIKSKKPYSSPQEISAINFR